MENKDPYNYQAVDLIPLCIGEYFRLNRLQDNPQSIPEKMPLSSIIYHLYQATSIAVPIGLVSSIGIIKGLEVLLN